MNIIFGIIILGGVAMIGYAVYGFISSSAAGSKIDTQPLPKDEPLSFGAHSKGNSATAPASLVAKMEDYVLQKETLLPKEEPQSANLLKAKEEELAKKEAELNKLKEESTALKNKLADKEKEIGAEFTKGVNLNKDLNEAKSKLDVLQKEVRERSDQLEAQKHQIERYAQQEKEYAKSIDEFKQKEEGSGWVSKAEYSKLKEELEAEEEKLKKLVEELEAVKAQLIDKASFETNQPKPEEPKDTKQEPPQPLP